MDDEKKAFYEYHSLPDGAVGRPGLDRLHRRQSDRRGARPQRPAPVALLRHQGRPGHHGLRSRRARHPAGATSCTRAACSPGRMFLVDTEQGRIVDDEEIKQQIAAEQPVPRSGWTSTWSTWRTCRTRPRCLRPITRRCCSARWPSATRIEDSAHPARADGARRRRGRRLDGQRHAAGRALDKPQLLYDYFKQLFAQVTNPPIDCIREEIDHRRRDARSARRATCSSRSRTSCRRIELKSPDPHQRGIREAPAH